MNKKKLPRAIRRDTADGGGAAAPEAALPARQSRNATTADDSGAVSPEARRAAAQKVVERFSVWSGAAGLIPLPFIDCTIVGVVQIQMLRRLSQIYGVPFAENSGKAFIASFVGSTIPASSGLGAASVIKSVPLVGAAVGFVVMPALSAGATYAIGMVFIEHFSSGGTFLDFDPAEYRQFAKVQNTLWDARSRAAAAARRGAARITRRTASQAASS